MKQSVFHGMSLVGVERCSSGLMIGKVFSRQMIVTTSTTNSWNFSYNWVVVSNIFYFHPENWGS